MKVTKSFFIKRHGLVFYQATFDVDETLRFAVLQDQMVDIDSKSFFTIVNSGRFKLKNDNMDTDLECAPSESRIGDGIVLNGEYSVTAMLPESTYTCLSVLSDRQLEMLSQYNISKFTHDIQHFYAHINDDIEVNAEMGIVLSGRFFLDGNIYASGETIPLKDVNILKCIESGHICLVTK